MRVGRDDWTNLDADDVAWVAEWQLAAAFRWIPIGEESAVRAEPAPDPGGHSWTVTISAGRGAARARLPVRDLARVIHWCHSIALKDLARPPASIRASLYALREAIRPALARFDPLAMMGYAPSHSGERGTGSQASE